jgi:signal transduction histidine kinase/ActR/RegA family two-component response regulator
MFRLLRYFTVTALVSLALAAVALTVLFTRAAEDDLIASAERANGAHARVFANALSFELGNGVWRFLRDQAPGMSAQDLRAHSMTRQMQIVLRELATGTNVVKVKVFSREGLTLYSSEASQIGEAKHNSELIQRAVRGESVSSISERETFMSFDGEINDRSLVSTYVPAIQPGTIEPTAVFELYSDLTPLKRALEISHKRQFLIVVSVMTALFLLQFLIVRRGSRIIDRQREGLEAANHEVESARKLAEQANAAKSRFLANMSHEIRTPMHGMLGMTELLCETRLDEQQSNFVATIKRSGLSLMKILNDILDMSKIEAGKLLLDIHAFELRTLVRDAVELMGAQARAKQLNLVVQVDPGVSEFVQGDALRLQQVLQNLVGNAIKFTAGGSVTVNVMNASSPGHVRISVTDTGIGISNEAAQKLFAPFVQAEGATTRQFGGTGLGLAISRQLVELMSGRLELTSTPGIGSTFSFSVRLEPSEIKQVSLHDTQRMHVSMLQAVAFSKGGVLATVPMRVGEAPDGTSRGNRDQLSVLLVEDNAVNVMYAEAVLARLNVRVVIAGDGLEAIEAAKREAFAVILMDCNMPDMDGYTAASSIRSLEMRLGRSRVPIIALSASAMVDERDRCIEAGMDDFLAKPFLAEELCETVKQWCPSLGIARAA